jgi:hypothetical protein
MQPWTWHNPSMQPVRSAAHSELCVQARAQSVSWAQPPAGPQATQTRCRTKPAPHDEAVAITQRPASHAAFLLRQGSAKHCTPGPPQTGSGSLGPSGRQSHPVHMNANARQSASLRHCALVGSQVP